MKGDTYTVNLEVRATQVEGAIDYRWPTVAQWFEEVIENHPPARFQVEVRIDTAEEDGV